MKKRIVVTVQYVGDIDFVEEVPEDMELQAVKINAMKHFELEVGKNADYTLQFNGADISDHGKVGDFDRVQLTLTLTMTKEPTKG